MSCFKNLRYELYAFLDQIFKLSGYFEGVIDARECAVAALKGYVSHLIEYFEDIPFIGAEEKNSENLKILERFLERANTALEEIHGSQRRVLRGLESNLLFVMMQGSDFYAERNNRRGNSKSIFDARSSEIKHLLYMMDGAEHFMYRDIFIKARIFKGRLTLKLDRQTIESRKGHEYEFSDEVRTKCKASKSGEI